MISQTTSRDGSHHVTDERINTITHMAAACLALLGSVLLIAKSISGGDVWQIVGFSIYGFSLVNLFVMSTLHHGLNVGPRANSVLRTLDYAAVFGLIAGTITPIVLVLQRGVFGYSVLGVSWVIAATGITIRSVFRQLPKFMTNTLYIVMGWLPITLLFSGAKIPSNMFGLLAAGGIVYSLGFIVYVIEKPNVLLGVFGFHEIWHILVVVAAMTHLVMMYLYVL